MAKFTEVHIFPNRTNDLFLFDDILRAVSSANCVKGKGFGVVGCKKHICPCVVLKVPEEQAYDLGTDLSKECHGYHISFWDSDTPARVEPRSPSSSSVSPSSAESDDGDEPEYEPPSSSESSEALPSSEPDDLQSDEVAPAAAQEADEEEPPHKKRRLDAPEQQPLTLQRWMDDLGRISVSDLAAEPRPLRHKIVDLAALIKASKGNQL